MLPWRYSWRSAPSRRVDGAALATPLAACLVVGLLGIDLFLFADGFHPLKPRETSFPPLAELEPLRSDPGLFRVGGWGDTLIPNSALVYGLQDYRGYDGVGVRHYSDLLDVGFRYTGSFHALVTFATPHLLDLLNVKYVLIRDDVDVPAERFTMVKDGPVRVYRNDRALPRAFLADGFVTLEGDAARRAMRSGAIDFRRTVVLESPPATAPSAAQAGSDLGTAVVRQYDDHRVTIETQATGQRLLVLSDTHYPGWTATVDGVSAPILRANYAFRAVSVPAGAHRVDFRYRPRSFTYGLLLSALGLLAAGTLASRRRTLRQAS